MEPVDYYPVVTQRALAIVPRRGTFGMGRRVRSADEVPTISAEQVRVFRVGSAFRLDDGQYTLDSDDVVDATHVSVVDVSTNRTVRVPISLASAEGRDFTATITFACHVFDPISVVRHGATNAQQQLLDYVKSHRRLFELGTTHVFEDVDYVRRDVDAQVSALVTVVPPEIDGISVTLRGTEVLTPEGLAEARAKEAEAARAHQFNTSEVRRRHDLEMTTAKGQLGLDRHQVTADQLIAKLRTEGDLELSDLTQARRLDQFDKLSAKLTDQRAAMILGYTTGERSIEDVSQAIRESRSIDRADGHLTREYETRAMEERQRGRVEVLRILADLGILDNLEVDAAALLNEVAFGALPTAERAAVEEAPAVPVGASASREDTGQAREEDD